MALLGNLVSRSLRIRKQFTIQTGTPRTYQVNTLLRLLSKAQYTQFGRHYNFEQILKQPNIVDAYKKQVPTFNYNEMWEAWWHRLQEGQIDVSWPGKVKYFALSSGTSESASKHIPVTQDMLKSIKKWGMKQLYSMANFNIPPKSFEKGILMLGGTTSLYEKDDYYEGDMSGISAKTMPRWLSYFFYKPGISISKKTNWQQRIKLIVRMAPQWDVGTVCGVPAWVQIVFEEIIKYHKVKNIHEIWPNLAVYIHGGVSFEPYRENFQKLLGKPITFIETYMASEGSFGFTARPGAGIKLVLNAGVFYEFVPFNSENFDDNGNLKPGATTYMIHEVVEDRDYAVLLSTASGAWRYLIGDVIKFTNAREGEIAIVGRTKQFLSLCGEHMSVDNMNKAIDNVQRKLGITIREFTVAGFKYENLFAHRWYIGCDDLNVNKQEVLKIIDETLCEQNDDYAVERTSALKEVFLEVLPNDFFYEYLRLKGKEGAMNKFPRVLKGDTQKDWEQFLASKHL